MTILANQEDLKFGLKHEAIIKKMLEDMYSDTNYKVEYHSWKFSSFDFKIVDENNNIVHEYELKTRRIKSTTYPTLMFGETKLNYAKSQYKKRGGRFSVLWYCINDKKLLEWEWNPNIKDYENGYGQSKLRHEKEKKCIHISTDIMTEICYE